MSKEAIINKIKSDANAKVEQMTAEQQAKVSAVLEAVDKECEQLLVKTRRELEEQEAATLARSETVAQLDAKRLILDARLEIVDRVFARALEKLVALDDEAMRELLLNMLEAAEDGDEVVLNARGRELVGESGVKSYAKKRGIALSLADEDGDFAGGLVLRQGGIDKNLTFEVELSLLRDRDEAQIAKQIFG